MTTRITLAILVTTWLILIVGETAAFLTARQSLLAMLDDTIITRATRLVETSVGPTAPDTVVYVPEGDIFEIRNDLGAVVAAGTGEEPARHVPALIRKEFQTLPDGTRVRTIALRMILERDGRKVPVTINYSRPTEKFQWLLSHLAGMLLLISLACGLATAWLALKLSRAALKPLRETAEVIAGIDEKNLSRRIDAEQMPGELTAMAQRLNEMLARLEAVFRQRKQFLADAAHELRTPTAALLTTLEVSLRRPRDQVAMIEAMNSGLADARRLRKLVEQLMEHARGEHVRAEQAMQRTDIGILVRECVSVVAPLAREKGVQLRHDVPETLPFVTQHDRLRSVLLNLLSNSIEYNRPDGSIDVHCTHDGNQLTMTVADTGRGISADQLEHVFEPFYRGSKRGSRGDDPAHLGLGLFLVRSHIDALHGRCEIQSQMGEGTTIRVILPDQAERARPSPPERRPVDEAVVNASS